MTASAGGLHIPVDNSPRSCFDAIITALDDGRRRGVSKCDAVRAVRG